MRFLESIDPDYFGYNSLVHSIQLGGENDEVAALALRMNYSHSLESLFAFVGAAVQAPYLPSGWLLAYKNSELKNLTSRISHRENFSNLFGISRGWKNLVEVLTPWQFQDKDRLVGHRKALERILWKLADEFLNPLLMDEYNSAKHGARIRSTAWQLATGFEETPGISASPDQMKLFGSSVYGSTYLRASRLKNYQYEVEVQRVNWDPRVLEARTLAAVGAMKNVLMFMKWMNGAPSDSNPVPVLSNRYLDESKILSSDYSTSQTLSFRGLELGWSVPDLNKEQILEDYLHKALLFSKGHFRNLDHSE